jgi:hypothetical protein
LQKQIQALDAALKTDRDVLRDTQRQASAQASEEVAATHRAIAADALNAIRLFDAACAAEQALVAQLGGIGYDANFRMQIGWLHIGRLQDVSSSAVWHYERSLAAYAKK